MSLGPERTGGGMRNLQRFDVVFGKRGFNRAEDERFTGA